MRPKDRALNIAVIGLGQGGGNIAAQFSRLGYPIIALNTALTDLSALEDEDEQHPITREQRVYIGIDGYDGAGGDLNYGRECVRENADRIRNVVMEHTAEADIVLITASLGGGTGSAVSELVTTLQDMDLPLMVLATLPTDFESGMAKVNAMRGASALVKTDSVSWIFVDNSRLAERHSDVSLDRYFETINAEITAPLDALNRLNYGLDCRPIRTLDGEDLRRLLLSGGAINYATDQLVPLNVEAVLGKLRAALESSSLMPSGFALEQVTTMGVVIQASEEVLACTPFSFFERLNERMKEATGGAAIYLGVYRSQARASVAHMQFICSSQQLPDGILAMVNDARREGGTLRDKLQQTLAPLDVGEIEQFDLFRTNARSSPGRKGKKRPSLLPDLSDEGLALSANAPRRRPGSSAPSAGTDSGAGTAETPEPVPVASTARPIVGRDEESDAVGS